MRNLKKALSLVLALVFVLGLCTIGAGAAFDDAADIQYNEAITVLSGLGIVQGDDNDFDGKMEFRPLDGVTRAQAAKMITYMMLGSANAEKLISKQVFDDVAANNWAAKYIYFCYQKGIINGYGDGNFGPADPVTGTQLAKMLLCAAGYGCMGEYTGEGWDVNVFIDAVSEGIFEDANTADFSVAATREEAALYVFNTLMTLDQVAYDVDVNKYVKNDGDGTFAKEVWNLKSTTDEADKDKVFVLEANQATGAKYTVINEKNYAIETGLDLIGHDVEIYFKNDEKTDAEGNKYYEAYLVEDVSTVIALGGQTLGELAKQVVYDETPFNTVEYWVNYNETGDYLDTITTLTSFKKGTEYNFTKIEECNNATAGEVAAAVIPADSLILDAEGHILSVLDLAYEVREVKSVADGTIVLNDAKAYVPAAKAVKGDNVYTNAYEGIAKGDYVTLQPVGKLFEIYPTSVAEASITEISNRGGYYYFNLSAFGPCTDAEFVTVEDEVAPANVLLGDSVEFYLDYYGKYFAIDVIAHGASKGNVLLVDTYYKNVETYNGSVKNYYAQCIDAEGNVVDYLIESADASLTMGVYSLYTTTSTEYHAAGDTVAKFDTVDTDLSDQYEFKGYGEDNKLPGTNKYFADDMVIIYFNGQSLENLKVATASYLNNAKEQVYTYVDASETVPVMWIIGTAPADVADSYLYVVNFDSLTYASSISNSKVSVNGNDIYYYMAFIDGALSYYVPVKTYDGKQVEYNGYFNGYYLPAGFYTYSVDADGLYILTTVSAAHCQSEVAITKDNIYKGKLSIANMFDDVDISGLKVVDLCHGDDANGYARSINSVDALLDILEEGLTVKISFATVYDGNYRTEVPTGTLYVNYYG